MRCAAVKAHCDEHGQEEFALVVLDEDVEATLEGGEHAEEVEISGDERVPGGDQGEIAPGRGRACRRGGDQRRSAGARGRSGGDHAWKRASMQKSELTAMKTSTHRSSPHTGRNALSTTRCRMTTTITEMP